MARLIKILAASVGGGLVLGAGIRLGEAIANWEPAAESDPTARLAERLATIEGRLQRFESGPWTTSVDLEPESSSASAEDTSFFGNPSFEGPRAELQDWIQENISARMQELETRLRADSEHGQEELLDTIVQSVQTRVIQRITQLEEEVAGQSAAMNELRECSLRTERSVQQLLGGLDKLIAKPEAAPTDKPVAPDESRPRSGWRILGLGR